MRLTLPLPALLRRVLTAALGVAVFAVGNFLTVKANVGQAPWNVLCVGLSFHLPLSYGAATVTISLLIVLTDLLLGEPIGVTMLLDTLIVGPVFDLLNSFGLMPMLQSLWGGLALMTFGMVLLAVGQLIYMPACLGCGPRAALTVGAGRRLKRLPIGVTEILIQSSACLIGWLLGGGVGIGTLWFALGNGLIMQVVFHIARFEPRGLVHLGIHQLVARRPAVEAGKSCKE